MSTKILSQFIGKVFAKASRTDDAIVFILQNGDRYEIFHDQDCCEGVYIEDIVGDLECLENSPILEAEEVSYIDEDPQGVPVKNHNDVFEWTFYKFATIKGYVTIRFYGESNGYYSTTASVHFRKLGG